MPKQLKEVDDRFLFERYKIWLHNENKIDVEYDDDFNKLKITIYLKANPRFILRSYSDNFIVNNKHLSINFIIFDLRKFMQEFDLPYSKFYFSCIERLKNNIDYCNESIEGYKKEIIACENFIDKIKQQINLPLEFE